jgi:DNA-binding Lrp family transcriptional regulator
MPTAFIFLRVKLGTSDQVLYDLKQILHVQDAHLVYGKFDIIAKVKASTMQELKSVVTQTIRQMHNIRSSQSMVVMDG